MFASGLSKASDLVTGALWLTKSYVRYGILRMASTHSKPTVEKHGNAFTVTILPALDDNFMYLITDLATNEAAVVDPADADRVKETVDKHGQQLKTILTTHHHWDHAGGNNKMLQLYPKLKVISGDKRAEGTNKIVQDGDTFTIGKTQVKCIFTPCHTSGHIFLGLPLNGFSPFWRAVWAGKRTYRSYFVTGPDDGEPAVFTGDTLFLAGCGKFFEGTPDEMYQNLAHKLGKLPDETKVYCGHEYSLQNLKFAQSVDPDNSHLKDKMNFAKKRRDERLPVPPSTIAEEKSYNPFMRVNDAQQMGDMRERKNNFK